MPEVIMPPYHNMRMLEKDNAFQDFEAIKWFPLSKKEKLQELRDLLKMLCEESGKTAADLQRIRGQCGMGEDFATERPLFCLQKAISEIENENELRNS